MAIQKTGIAVGIHKGHVTTRRDLPPKPKSVKAQTKTDHTGFVRDIIKEVAGFAPYERRLMEMMRNNQDKRARRFAKRRLGTYGRAKKKVDDIQNHIAESRRAG